MKKLLFPLLALVAAMTMASCDEDTDKYKSKLPTFSDITFNKETIYTDETVTATAVQYKEGQLLDMTQYVWYSNMPSDSTMTWHNSVLYPNNPSNPTCTFRTPEYPGSFTITFHGSYRISGRATNGSKSAEISHGTVKYEYTPLTGYVTINKTFRVVKRPD